MATMKTDYINGDDWPAGTIGGTTGANAFGTQINTNTSEFGNTLKKVGHAEGTTTSATWAEVDSISVSSGTFTDNDILGFEVFNKGTDTVTLGVRVVIDDGTNTSILGNDASNGPIEMRGSFMQMTSFANTRLIGFMLGLNGATEVNTNVQAVMIANWITQAFTVRLYGRINGDETAHLHLNVFRIPG